MNLTTLEEAHPRTPAAPSAYSALGLAKALGLGKTTVDRIRKASWALGDPLSRYATPADVRAWLQRWPMFAARHWVGGEAQWMPYRARYIDLNRQNALAGKSGAPLSRRVRPTP